MTRFNKIALIIGLVLAGATVFELNKALWQERETTRVDLEMAYFPSGAFLKQAVMGYDALAADLAWLKAIQYYGKHRQGDQLFLWLDHIFNIITELDPNFINAYVFGSLVITQDAQKPELAIALLKKGIRNNPDNWYLYFETGFLYYIACRDYQMAARYFIRSSDVPNAPLIGRRWAAFLAQKGSDFEKSRTLWQDVYEQATDDYTKKVAERALKYLILDYNSDLINKLSQQYSTQVGHYPTRVQDLVTSGLLPAAPKDPFDGFYIIDPQTGVVYSSIRQNEKISMICNSLTSDANRYRNQFGHYPKSVKEMQDADIVPDKIEIPYGTSYYYNSNTGTATAILVQNK